MTDPNTLESMEETDRKARIGLTEEQQEQLSKALFPDTHTDESEVLILLRVLPRRSFKKSVVLENIPMTVS